MSRFDLSRRAFVGLAGAGLAALDAGRAAAQRLDMQEEIALWPALPPGHGDTPPVPQVEDHAKTPGHPDRLIRGVAVPRLVVRRAERPNGAAMLLMPGGGYEFQGFDNEGTRQADWLNARGITAFILVYRLPAEGWRDRSVVPLQDAQRAMRLIRTGAEGFGIDPERVGAMGFSAGGHLGGMLATRWDMPSYRAVDAADSVSARPDLAALIYPVITMRTPLTHAGSRAALLGESSAEAEVERFSVDTNVAADTPPVFLMHASDDAIVPVQNSIMMYNAMLAHRRPAALHLFEKGGHGFGVNLPDHMPASSWPKLFTDFAAAQNLFGAE